MSQVKKILCPIDFSEATDFVTEFAAATAEAFQAELILLYVAPRMNRYADLYVPVQDLTKVVESVVSGAKEKMQTLLGSAFKHVQASGRVVVGYAPEDILVAAEKENVDLIVMGTHGRRALDRIIFGSVAEKVSKNARIPVLMVRPARKTESLSDAPYEPVLVNRG